jgi:RNA polymerase sigma-70 factor (ECF subfamily)
MSEVGMTRFAETLEAAQCGEEWAVSSLWYEFQPALLRYLRGRQRDAADDVASETWLRVARDLRRFRGTDTDFRAWLFTIARHALIDWQRRSMRLPATTGSLDLVEDPPARDDTEAAAIDAIDTRRVLALIAELPPEHADVVLLRVVAGLDIHRVAGIMRKRPGTVRVIQHRALRRLAELVDAAAPSGMVVAP